MINVSCSCSLRDLFKSKDGCRCGTTAGWFADEADKRASEQHEDEDNDPEAWESLVQKIKRISPTRGDVLVIRVQDKRQVEHVRDKLLPLLRSYYPLVPTIILPPDMDISILDEGTRRDLANALQEATRP